MEPEPQEGKIEYKLKLLNKNSERVNELASQMRYRVNEGCGEALYVLGVTDSGEMTGISPDEYDNSLLTLNSVANKNVYSVNLLTKKDVGEDKAVYEVLIREINENKYIDVKVAVAGNVNAGKSSTIGTLITGNLDNGRGSSRLNVFNYSHEVKTGRTSSVAHQILGFDESGNVTNYNKVGKKSWPEIVKDSQKIISFMDMAGHAKYLKTTIIGMTSSYPDFCLIMVGGNMGISRMTREHIFLCVTLNIPFVIVITKIDICEDRQNVLQETIDKIYKILKLPGVRRIPYKVKQMDDVILCAKNIQSQSIVPIFKISNVTGEGIDHIRSFLNLATKKKRKDTSKSFVQFHIDTIFSVRGVGVVVGGHLVSGTVKLHDKLLLGPDMGKFRTVGIKGIHCKRVPLTTVSPGSYVCFALKKVTRESVRKGHVLISGPPMAAKEFEAEISIMRSNHTTIKPGYEPVIHTSTIRQAAVLVSIKNKRNARARGATDDLVLRTGDRARCRFKFSYRSEFIKKNMRVIFSDGIVKVIGIIKEVYYD